MTEKSLASALKDGGYNTWHIGKWHLGKSDYYPDKHGFKINIGGCHLGHPPKGYFSPYNIENLEDRKDGECLTDRLTEEAINLIKSSDGKPFFLNLWYYDVHTPVQSKPEYREKYIQKKKQMGLEDIQEFEEGDYFLCDHKKHLRINRRLVQSDPNYAGMIENLDRNIGALLSAVEKMGITDNTMIVFTSDNGGLSTAEGSPTCNDPLNEGKGWMYEGGVRVPLIVKCPSVTKPGSICTVPVTSPDFYPTLLQIANMELIPSQHTDGVSLIPLLKGEKTIEREAIYWHYPHYGNQGGTPGSSIRMGTYKLIEFFEDGRLELYNLEKDLEEEHNLSEEMPDLAKKMQNMLARWRESVDAKIPVHSI